MEKISTENCKEKVSVTHRNHKQTKSANEDMMNHHHRMRYNIFEKVPTTVFGYLHTGAIVVTDLVGSARCAAIVVASTSTSTCTIPQ